jgi:hypothetical protein
MPLHLSVHLCVRRSMHPCVHICTRLWLCLGVLRRIGYSGSSAMPILTACFVLDVTFVLRTRSDPVPGTDSHTRAAEPGPIGSVIATALLSSNDSVATSIRVRQTRLDIFVCFHAFALLCNTSMRDARWCYVVSVCVCVCYQNNSRLSSSFSLSPHGNRSGNNGSVAFRVLS